MVKTSHTVTLRRQWTDKLQHRCLKTELPPGVRVRPTETREEVVLESSNLSDLCEAVSKIKRLVIDQLVSSGVSSQTQSNGIDKTDRDDLKADEDMDKGHKQKDVSVEGVKTLGVKYEERDHTRLGKAKDDSRRTADDRKEQQKEMKKKHGGGLQSNQHRGPPHDGARRHRETASTDDSEQDVNDSHYNTASAESEQASAAESVQKCFGDVQARTAKDDSRRTANDRKEQQKEMKKKHRGGLESNQHRGPPHDGVRRHRETASTDDSEQDVNDSHDDTASAKSEQASATESAQKCFGDVQARTEDREPYENQHTAPVVTKKQLPDNNDETNVSPKDDASAVSNENEKYQIDEPLWAYIQFIDPQVKWVKKLKAFRDRKQGNDIIELTGSSTDIDTLKNFCDTGRLQRAITRKLLHVPSGCTADFFQGRLFQLSNGKVLTRLVEEDDPKYCELVGKRSDIGELEKEIYSCYPELVETQQMPDTSIQQPTTSTGPASVIQAASVTISSAVANTFYAPAAAAAATGNDFSRGFDQRPSGMTVQTSEAGFEFQTALAQLRVRIVTGDILQWRCEVLVNPCDSGLSHAGGLASLFAKAAGYKMQAECKAYIRQHGYVLPQCFVMDTTAGNIQPPVRRLIHACGPNARLCCSDYECGTLLERTFLNCLLHANDNLLARSIALPAISSGTRLHLHTEFYFMKLLWFQFLHGYLRNTLLQFLYLSVCAFQHR